MPYCQLSKGNILFTDDNGLHSFTRINFYSSFVQKYRFFLVNSFSIDVYDDNDKEIRLYIMLCSKKFLINTSSFFGGYIKLFINEKINIVFEWAFLSSIYYSLII